MANKYKRTNPQRFSQDSFDGIEIAMQESRTLERTKREAALAATRKSAEWAGFAMNPEYQARLSTHEAGLVQEIANLGAPETDEVLVVLKSMSNPVPADFSRVFGKITGAEELSMSVRLLKEEGGVLASVAPGRFGHYVIETPCTDKLVLLEILDEGGRLLFQDVCPIELSTGGMEERNYTLNRCGDFSSDAEEDGSVRLVMPDLKDELLQNAEEILAQLGDFSIVVNRSPDVADEGLVIEQEPAVGQPIVQGDEITLVVSLGPQTQARMPQLVGMPVVQARKELAGHAFATLRFDYVDAPNDVGKVVKQEPKAEAPLGSDTGISLCIGQAPKLMPDVMARSEADARAILVPDFAPEVSVTYRVAEGTAGIVIEQSPKRETVLAQGIAISMVASKDDRVEVSLEMPNLTKMTVAAAEKTLSALGSFIVQTKVVEHKLKKGQVFSQAPQAGTVLRSEQKILLGVSLGPSEALKMPNLDGLKAAQVKAALADRPLAEVTIEFEPSDKPEGTVIKQSPAASAVLQEGVRVSVTFAKPEAEGERSRMPELKGKTAAQAKRALAKVGVTAIEFDATEARRSGARVLSQSPKAGQLLRDGETVALRFGRVDR